MSQDKLDANSRTIASDAHRAWKKKWAIKFKQSVHSIRIKHVIKRNYNEKYVKFSPSSCPKKKININKWSEDSYCFS